MHLELDGQVSVHDLNYWNFILKVEYSYMEIYLTSLILLNCTFAGFSSQRITPMIQFCSGVYPWVHVRVWIMSASVCLHVCVCRCRCNCVYMCVCESVKTSKQRCRFWSRRAENVVLIHCECKPVRPPLSAAVLQQLQKVAPFGKIWRDRVLSPTVWTSLWHSAGWPKCREKCC